MNLHIQILLLILSLICINQAIIPPNYTQTATINLIDNIDNIGYSHNQKHLVILQQNAQGYFFTYNGIHLNNKLQINIADQLKQSASPSAFAFSKNDDLLVIGTKQGGIYGFTITNGNISENYSYKFALGTKIQQNGVKSISIDKDKNIAVAAKNTLLILTIPTTKTLQDSVLFNNPVNFPFAHIIQSLCWSILQPQILIVGAMAQSNGNFTLFNTTSKTQKQINNQKTQSVAISPDGKTILKTTIDKNIDVYAYQIGGIPTLAQNITNTNSSKQLQFSQNGAYFGAQINGGKVMAWTVNSNSQSNLKIQNNDLQLTFTLNLDQQGSNLALSNTGNDILIIPNDNSAQIPKYSLCLDGKFFDSQAKDCTSCSQNCATCFNLQTCISCNNDKFISGDMCYLCNTKLDGCLTCSSSENCLKCNNQTNWNQTPDNGKCTCQNTFFNKNGACSECGVFLDCITCSGENNCTTCKQQANFDSKPVEGHCVCKNQFWLNQTQCIQCQKSIKDCLDCSLDGQKCTKCQSDDRKPNQDESKCVCVDYKYEAQNLTCQLCDPNQNCIQCQDEAPNDCLKCDTNKNRKQKPQNGICICQDTYYDKEGKCQLCSIPINECNICLNNKTCLLCKNQNHFDQNPQDGKCICVDGWILDNIICKQCFTVIIGCASCTALDVCKVCNEKGNFIAQPTDDGKCKCQQTYFLNNTQCSLCSGSINGCFSCTSDGSTCLSCSDPTRKPSQDGKSCICKQYTYQDANNVCQPCDVNKACIYCNQTKPDHDCIECDGNNHWNSTPVNGICKCQDGYNFYNTKCIFCKVPGCSVCEQQTTCKQCDETKRFKPQPDGNYCNCIPETYRTPDKKSCQYCSQSMRGCKQCSNAGQCETCDQVNHFIIDPTNNDCHCMKTFYLKNNLTCESCSIIEKCLQCAPSGQNILCNKCQAGWGTANNNLTCISCNTVGSGCLDCSDSKTCTSCDVKNNFIQNGSLCMCNKGFYLKDGNCKVCSNSIPGCKVCGDQNTCTQCTNEGNFNPAPNKDNKCSCNQGWTLDPLICKSCNIITGCLACSDINTCQKCNQAGSFQINDKNKCQCKNTHYLNQTICLQCKASIFNCGTCSQNGQVCDSCLDPNRILNQDHTACQCSKFMYEDMSRQCQYCDSYKNCAQCQKQGDHQCTKCDVDKFWIQKPNQGNCICQPNYIEFNHACVLCQVIGCKQCQQQNKCSLCQQQKKFRLQPVQNICKCQPNTIFDVDQCYFCSEKIVGCKNCQKLTECTECNQQNYFILDQQTKKCVCDVSHYLISPDCKPCSEGIKYCQQCIINAQKSECTQCKKGFPLSDDKKSCLNCQDLIVGCIDCLDTKSCSQCDQKHNFFLNGTYCQCNIGYYLVQKQCVSCSKPIPGCTKCNDDASQCSQCNQINHFVLNDDTKKCDCINEYFFKEDECVSCSTPLPGCKSCSKDGSLCNECLSGYFLQQGKCSLCSSTITGCTKCNSDGTKCQQCKTDKFVFNQTTEKCDCIQTYFFNNGQCSLCVYKLMACNKCNQNGTECLQCMYDHFVLNKQTKQCVCQDPYYLKTKVCQLCQTVLTGCLKCSEDGLKCKQCKGNQSFVLDQQTNKCVCADGYFLNSGKCQLCSQNIPGCSICNPQGKQCDQCNETAQFILNNQTKQCQCKDSYYVESNVQCKICSSAITYCLSCKSQGQQFTPYCSTCKQGFEPNQFKTSCICSGNDKQIVDGQCQDKKTSSWVIFVIISGGALIVIGVGAAVYFKYKKSRSKLDLYEQMQDEDNVPRRKNPQTIITDNNTISKIGSKSSQSLDVDQ